MKFLAGCKNINTSWSQPGGADTAIYEAGTDWQLLFKKQTIPVRYSTASDAMTKKRLNFQSAGKYVVS